MKKFLKSPVTLIIFGVIMMFFIIGLSVTFTLNYRQLYYHDIIALDIEKNSGYSYDDIKENYDALIEYNSFTGPEDLHFPSLPMSEEGRIHFVEVKALFLLFEKFAIGCGIITLIGTILMLKNKEIRFLKYASIITVTVPAIIGLFVAINWEKAFVAFHKIAFNNDYWIFDEVTDPVITILPEEFFFHAAILIIGLVITGAAICMIIYLLLKKRLYPKQIQ